MFDSVRLCRDTSTIVHNTADPNEFVVQYQSGAAIERTCVQKKQRKKTTNKSKGM
jgi:hypothetical protein